MTIPTYDPLTSDDTGADKILTTGTVVALDQNPVSIAGRGTSAPRVQVPVREYKTSGTAATWTIPAGVTAFTIYVIGGGQEAFAGGNAGGDSTVVYNSVTYTGGCAGPSPGVGTNGDLNVTGTQSGAVVGTDDSPGGIAAMFGGGSYGAGGNGIGGNRGGHGAGLCIKRIVVVDGQTSATYTVGAGGTGGTGENGKDGLIIFEY